MPFSSQITPSCNFKVDFTDLAHSFASSDNLLNEKTTSLTRHEELHGKLSYDDDGGGDNGGGGYDDVDVGDGGGSGDSVMMFLMMIMMRMLMMVVVVC
jgi:hypothetical protein